MSISGSVSSSTKWHGSSGQPGSQRGERPEMANEGSHHHHHHHHHCDPEWEAKEELRLRELEEARARATQMEKTMRWWSDCTANWREKWCKVRTERNKSREESRVLRGRLESTSKECNVLKREREELLHEIDKLRKEVTMRRTADAESLAEKKEAEETTSYAACERVVAERDIAEKPGEDGMTLPFGLDPLNNNNTSIVDSDLSTLGLSTSQDLDFLDKLFYPKDDTLESVSASVGERKSNSRICQRNVDDFTSPIQELAEQKLAMLQLRLDETTKTISAERQEKNKLMKAMEKLQTELSQLRAKYEDLKRSKQDTLKELNQLKAEHQDEMDSIRLDLEDEANNRSSLDQRLAELRSEVCFATIKLERLQAENAAEWGRRERLETEKLALERENKKLHTQIEDLEDRLERKTKQMTSASDSDVKTLQGELHEKNKELADLKHAHGKLKKVLQDKSTELSHALRRSEQYETEVKKLRFRIEELKKELAVAEDEIDSATNSIRKLQRTNEELQEQLETLQLQIEHLQSRLSAVLPSSILLVKDDIEPPTSDTTPLNQRKNSDGNVERGRQLTHDISVL